MLLLLLFSLDSSDAPRSTSVPIQLALEGIGRIGELIGAPPIEKDTHDTVFLARLLRRRGKLMHQKCVHRLLFHIVTLAVDHGCPRFLCSHQHYTSSLPVMTSRLRNSQWRRSSMRSLPPVWYQRLSQNRATISSVLK